MNMTRLDELWQQLDKMKVDVDLRDSPFLYLYKKCYLEESKEIKEEIRKLQDETR
jgi:hypothetical protein